jgi:serine/threonine-protein kinase PknK
MRRLAWGLGARGAKIAWLSAEEIPTQPPSTEAPARGEGERKPTSPPLEALRLELAAYPSPRGVTLLVDDAAHLAPDVALAVEEAAAAGARLVLVVDPDGQMPVRTSTLDVVTQAPLEHARELVRRVAPSLPEAVVSHVLARSGSLPGPLRALLTKLEGRAVVSPDDVDALASPPRGGVADVHALLDRGRFEEAAEALAALPDDGTPSLAIARSRLFTNRGEPVLALLALLAVEHAVASDPDPLVRARWHLHAARAHLRKGDYARAEEHASAVPSSLARAEQRPRSDREPLEELEHAEHMEREARALEAEAAAVEGLALSYEGELERADGRLRESVASARALGDDRVLALALGSLGFGLQKADRLDEARVAYDEARAAAERAGDAGSVATTRLNLASIAKTQGDLGNAISHLEAAVDMGRRSGRVATLRQALSNLANLELYLGRLARARVSIDALAAERAALAPHQRAQLLALEAEHAQRAGDLEAAATLCGECAEVYEQLGRAIDAAEAHLERALALAWQSDVPDRDVATAIERARALLAGGSAHRALLALAEARLAMRTPTQDGARERLDLALSAARAAGQRDLVWRALEARASLEQQAGASVTAARGSRRGRGRARGDRGPAAARSARGLLERSPGARPCARPTRRDAPTPRRARS